jgi:hypothetical protein
LAALPEISGSSPQVWYPQARIEVANDSIILKDSPALISYRKIARLTLP